MASSWRGYAMPCARRWCSDMAASFLSYLNGCFVPSDRAAISLHDAGFLWGATIADRLRTFNRKPFRLDAHLKRFRQSCELAYVPQPRNDAEITAIVHELIEINGKQLPPGGELSIVLFATPGRDDQPTFGVDATLFEFARYASMVGDGVSLQPLACENLIPPAIKHRSRVHWWISKHMVGKGNEPLFTTASAERHIRETPTANFLAVIEDELVSPPRSTILNGIGLAVVQELAGALGIPFREREITTREGLNRAGECLLTNSSFCLAPVSRLAGLPKLTRGPMFDRLGRAWNDLVGLNILSQITSKR